jgi:Flp pilus assembly pilin Flp
MLNNFLKDESGFIVSAELVLIFTLVFCAVAVGMATVKDALAQELGDVAEAIGALNQSYNFGGLTAPAAAAVSGTPGTPATSHASCSGSGFNDLEDECDCDPILLVAGNIKQDPSTVTGAGDDGAG